MLVRRKATGLDAANEFCSFMLQNLRDAEVKAGNNLERVRGAQVLCLYKRGLRLEVPGELWPQPKPAMALVAVDNLCALPLERFRAPR